MNNIKLWDTCLILLRNNSTYSSTVHNQQRTSTIIPWALIDNRSLRMLEGNKAVTSSLILKHQGSKRFLHRDLLGRIFLHLLIRFFVNCWTLLKCFSVVVEVGVYWGCDRAWRTMSTSKSSTLWLSTMEISKYVQSNILAIFSPS